MINLIYETFNPKIHDVAHVAKLVYDVDYRTFDMFFKSDRKAINKISRYLSRKRINNNFKVILDDGGKIIGYVSIYLSDEGHEFYFKSLRLFLLF